MCVCVCVCVCARTRTRVCPVSVFLSILKRKIRCHGLFMNILIKVTLEGSNPRRALLVGERGCGKAFPFAVEARTGHSGEGACQSKGSRVVRGPHGSLAFSLRGRTGGVSRLPGAPSLLPGWMCTPQPSCT